MTRWLPYAGLATALFLLLAGNASTRDTADGHDAIRRAFASTVQIFSERDGGVHRAASGVVFDTDDERSLIVTAAHVVEPVVDQSISVVSSGADRIVKGVVVFSDAATDVAVLSTPPLAVPEIRLQTETSLGDPMWVISYPWGKRATLVSGIVSQIGGEWDNTSIPMTGPVAMIDAPVSYGSSGGAIFDSSTGRLVGIVRGYKTAKLAVPGGDPVNFPLSGETTAVATSTILCIAQGTPAAALAAHGSAPNCADPTKVAGAR